MEEETPFVAEVRVFDAVLMILVAHAPLTGDGFAVVFPIQFPLPAGERIGEGD
jgi:hypothetical protein